MKKAFATGFALCLTGLLFAVPAAAQTYPSKPVRLITPFPPGGGTDVVARIIGEKLAELLGQPVVIDNKAGAGGSLGTELAARAAPDGYTLVLGSTATHAVNPGLYSKVGYDPVADFVAVSPVATTPLLLMVNPQVPANSVPELIALAKARGATAPLTFASAGSGSAQHLGGELFKTMTGTSITHIAYKGAGPAMADLLGGHVAMAFDTMPSALPQVRSGKLRGLGISSLKRHPALPDVPAIAETVPGYEYVSWYGVFAPKGTPPAIVDRLNADIKRALASKDVQDKFKTAGIDPEWSSTSDFTALVVREVPKWRKVIQQAGAKVD
ncbi:MAG: tripartite tricarboxylate transporter substrate binding protein [Hydrogenophaga sp.]|nr:tripartite tricarboxylate transporter substrate binding protein [Hydrogenophaga sp.]